MFGSSLLNWTGPPWCVNRLDVIAEALNADLAALEDFILPSGSVSISALHVARGVARRAERRLISFLKLEPQEGCFARAYRNRMNKLIPWGPNPTRHN
ncbi:ATP:cob(I)alamin adenosyltransferase [Phaeobacter gallaeciensis]|uniref:Corrinoid adenosyltransferase n=1 Tax=Phaeobacter gallaeciensis TaxID=60890 RepID=A0ABD4XEB9_9RHOB|nr:ATP:cob(I)alamin adenosyltransferase [Phaeobacter gallaeciensis]MDE4142208.1 ATP:cob(I)alamin adenosyltransferase [Phaeobacter gallaeciensis]MDE4146596.1 ATP:cob(I)alamin adenosyltransferase [Phaeobacter gallaeciensis]MDE4150669.1 ATP:cob(I)alamin adenosyltransferase [Phaeobacter gallaeciensis]MDE4154848.1 ATP:cob(I)alamin adenosyltransferase [Phaeobacter gallaeciensis]MDE4159262.1 ATP:cob(I)alamin adenosyltransferase [Phaeobacter gallaeciensis]